MKSILGASSSSSSSTTTTIALVTVATLAIIFSTKRIYGGKLVKRIKSNEDEEEETASTASRATNTTTSTSTLLPSLQQDLAKKQDDKIIQSNSILIFYTSTTGTNEKLATDLHNGLLQQQQNTSYILKDLRITLHKIESIDWWDEFSNLSENLQNTRLIFCLPTWTGGTLPPHASHLLSSLEEIQHDWRMEQHPLHSLTKVFLWGMGSSQYDTATFCKPVQDVSRVMKRLGAKIQSNFIVLGDDASVDWEKNWNKFQQIVFDSLHNEEVEKDYDDDEEDEEEEEPMIQDMEDLALSEEKKEDSEKIMTTPKQAKALKKEGYQLIGTHSAIKLCRWTKHQLRGRGGCYKHTCYGITSYQCMEATPSLACANKCVFCWRHHKNPVAKTWEWKMDEPEFIVKQGIQEHLKQIKQAKGIPGVMAERYIEAHTVRHCALSLVGEPIMYPKINELLHELHKRNISSFLVTNGQHPEAIQKLVPVTQLYVSIDAANQKSLMEVDRPLFKDAWERLRLSLKYLKEKRQRTVARLTIVKGFNEDDIQGYAELISLGLVHLVEIKGVTYCGKSGASNLNISNSPWHHEIIAFAQKLINQLNQIPNVPEYGLACEHKHSCTVLLARKDYFYLDNKWYTWIDYDKFNDHVMSSKQFEVQDYIAETPLWALYGSAEEGFDPTDKRHYRKKMKYTKFDEDGVPTHDSEGKELDRQEKERLRQKMNERIEELGGLTKKTHQGKAPGEKYMEDVSNMYRGETLPNK